MVVATHKDFGQAHKKSASVALDQRKQSKPVVKRSFLEDEGKYSAVKDRSRSIIRSPEVNDILSDSQEDIGLRIKQDSLEI